VAHSAYDPFDAEVIADPYPWYEALLRNAPVHHTERHDIWVLSRYDDVRGAARGHAAFSSAEGVAFQRMELPMMLTMDPPDHTRLRRLVARDFTPTAIKRWRPAVERFVGAAIDRMLEAGETDLVSELAAPLPIQVVAEVIGVPPDDYPDFKRWSDGIVEGFKLGDNPEGDGAAIARIMEVAGKLYAYVAAGAEERRARPRGDLFSQLLQPRDGETLSENELFFFFLLLLVAGNETTTNLLGNLAVALIDHPDQWDLLRARPDLVPSAVEEALRFGSPIQGFFRTALRPVEIEGIEIPEQARVLLLFAAANRDPRHYERPDAFDVARNPVDHLGFGSGIHTCLGAALARLETAVVLEQLNARIRTMDLSGEVTRTANPTLRGVTSLPVRVTAS
jgi:cytochrome P450